MPQLRYLSEVELHDPVMITAFAGWSDAGSAATTAAEYLIERWQATRLAEIEAEEFYDFTQLRPTVRYAEGNYRRIDWPENVFYYHQTPERDFIVLNGIEPHLRWQTYIGHLTEVIQKYKVKLVISIGSMFVEYPHTRPLRVTGSLPDAEMAARAGIVTRSGRYEGPTGISGVFSASLRNLDVQSGSIWANVPHYVSAAPNPSATLALLRSLSGALSFQIRLGRMVRASTSFDEQLSEATTKNDEVSDYVRNLEQQIDAESDVTEPAELPATDLIVQDIEEFLKRSSQES